MWSSLCVFSAAILAASAVPLYKQCDRRWGSNFMGVVGKVREDDTICDQGCAMSSVSMALASLGVTIDNNAVNPGSLNDWLRSNAGYVCIDDDCCNLVLDAPSRIPGSPLRLIGEKPKPDATTIQRELLSGKTVFVAHVRNNSHFVLVTGAKSATVFEVNDPFYNQTTYKYSDISDMIMYSVAGTGLGSLRGGRPSVVSDAPPLGTSVIPYPMPLWKQCDPRWGDDLIVSQTVCQVGCLMSSTSMALDGHKIRINNGTGSYTATPGSLNTWLKANGGYTQGNDMEESVVPHVDPSRVQWPADGMHRTNDLSPAQVQAMLKAGRPVIANVMHGEHFVLVVGWDAENEDTLVVNDPGFDRHTYSFSKDVVGWRLFDMKF